MTGWRLYGGLHSADVEKTTDQRLRQTLQGAFAVLLDGKPMVIKRHNEPTEMFHINDGRYVRHVEDPAKAGGGYAGTASLVKFDETALREELGQLAFTDDQVNAAIALARLMYVRS
jgi:hypothetical protein